MALVDLGECMFRNEDKKVKATEVQASMIRNRSK